MYHKKLYHNILRQHLHTNQWDVHTKRVSQAQKKQKIKLSVNNYALDIFSKILVTCNWTDRFTDTGNFYNQLFKMAHILLRNHIEHWFFSRITNKHNSLIIDIFGHLTKH